MERSGDESGSPWEALGNRIAALQDEVTPLSQDESLNACAKARNIVSIEEQQDLHSDGFIEPLGSSYIAGFRVVLRKEAPITRRRFTLAHEICHTFFYEFVPDLKFSGNQEDPFEEALCNYGAGCLLIPETDVRGRISDYRPCLSSLEALCDIYRVSYETMIVRLRSLRLWKCELSLWHRMSDGSFVIDKVYGRDRIEWNWSNVEVFERAWCSKCAHRGETDLWWENAFGHSTARSVFYELKRYGEALVALWDKRRLYEERPPLLR